MFYGPTPVAETIAVTSSELIAEDVRLGVDRRTLSLSSAGGVSGDGG